jgi:hypothetical protein
MAFDDDHDRALAREEAIADGAIASEAAKRREWLEKREPWLLTAFAEANADLWADFQRQQWDEYNAEEA